ncbi:hypothetical protein [Actinoplanes sp. ATCC 53533]|uniref:hypothetical protein n=1 Tax=Actinoplanes sp. ATCC 53533 TaxID=1288362 RepID=UPI0013153BD3|nr:hypothetical protein [Actinoplanes sp. ATCC 53533]
MAVWRDLVLSDPGRATGELREFLDSSYRPPSPIAADLEVLLTEALHRRHALVVAFDTSVEAARTAASLDPSDWPRLITALIIHADIVLCAGDDRAVAAATDAVALVTNLEVPDPGRLTLVRALRAVAVYHHQDGEQGKRELARLLRATPADTPIGAVLAAAATAMADGLRRCGPHQRPTRTPPPLRGGVLQPHLDAPATDELAYRVRAWPANRPPCCVANPRQGKP